MILCLVSLRIGIHGFHELFWSITNKCQKLSQLYILCVSRFEFVVVRRIRLEVFRKKVALKIFAKITGKHLSQSLFFNKVADLRHRCFPVNFVKFLRRTFLQNTSRQLLLSLHFPGDQELKEKRIFFVNCKDWSPTTHSVIMYLSFWRNIYKTR